MFQLKHFQRTVFRTRGFSLGPEGSVASHAASRTTMGFGEASLGPAPITAPDSVAVYFINVLRFSQPILLSEASCHQQFRQLLNVCKTRVLLPCASYFITLCR
jgi:hypothetical protein